MHARVCVWGVVGHGGRLADVFLWLSHLCRKRLRQPQGLPGRPQHTQRQRPGQSHAHQVAAAPWREHGNGRPQARPAGGHPSIQQGDDAPTGECGAAANRKHQHQKTLSKWASLAFFVPRRWLQNWASALSVSATLSDQSEAGKSFAELRPCLERTSDLQTAPNQGSWHTGRSSWSSPSVCCVEKEKVIANSNVL